MTVKKIAAYICDNCGAQEIPERDQPRFTRIQLTHTADAGVEEFDLCPECLPNLYRVVGLGGDGPRPQQKREARRKWTPEEDATILGFNRMQPAQAAALAEELGRTARGVKQRFYDLKRMHNQPTKEEQNV